MFQGGSAEMFEETAQGRISVGDVEELIADLEAELAVVDHVTPIVDTAEIVDCPCSCQCTVTCCTETTCLTHHC